MALNILAIDTADGPGSIAAAAGPRLLRCVGLGREQRTARSLVPKLGALLAGVGWKPADVRLVAVVVGPGSFTGLRIGVTTAKTFAYAVGAEILGVDSLEAIAHCLPPELDRVAVAVDAQRGEVVGQSFRRASDGWMRAEGPRRRLATDTWLDELPDGAAVSLPMPQRWADRAAARLDLVEPFCREQLAGAVAALAWRDYQAGRRDDVWSLLPVYSRRAAAEEKWEARHAPPPPRGE